MQFAEQETSDNRTDGKRQPRVAENFRGVDSTEAGKPKAGRGLLGASHLSVDG
jgi:hypothetical protein